MSTNANDRGTPRVADNNQASKRTAQDVSACSAGLSLWGFRYTGAANLLETFLFFSPPSMHQSAEHVLD